MRNFVGIGFLSSRTSICPTPGRNETGIRELDPDIPATTSVGSGSRGVVENDPIDPPALSTPRNLQTVGPKGYSSGQCPR